MARKDNPVEAEFEAANIDEVTRHLSKVLLFKHKQRHLLIRYITTTIFGVSSLAFLGWNYGWEMVIGLLFFGWALNLERGKP